MYICIYTYYFVLSSSVKQIVNFRYLRHSNQNNKQNFKSTTFWHSISPEVAQHLNFRTFKFQAETYLSIPQEKSSIKLKIIYNHPSLMAICRHFTRWCFHSSKPVFESDLGSSSDANVAFGTSMPTWGHQRVTQLWRAATSATHVSVHMQLGRVGSTFDATLNTTSGSRWQHPQQQQQQQQQRRRRRRRRRRQQAFLFTCSLVEFNLLQPLFPAADQFPRRLEPQWGSHFVIMGYYTIAPKYASGAVGPHGAQRWSH